MKSLLRRPVVSVVGIVVMLALTAAPAMAQFEMEYDPGTPEFQRTWDRTDKPVEDGVVSRTWNWGPGRTEVMTEPYEDSPGGMRQVQYFDKSRMEINDPNAPDDELWFVTNGLLVVEMVTGMMQVGDDAFEERQSADVNIVGDPGNEFSPTYANIAEWDLRDMPSDAEGDLITRTLDENGQAMDDESYASYGVTAAENVVVPGIDHTVAGPFWDFMNSSGPVWEDGQIVNDLLFPTPFYAVGLPITEAYWTTAPVAGTEADVLWQCFERRCLTYTPRNDEGFQVEAGNVGQHYWTWRYGQQPPPPGDFDGTYMVELDPLNESGVTGSATLTLEGDQLTVTLEASGLAADETHAQHIHGFNDEPEMASLLQSQMSTCPTPDLDTNGDGFVDVGEGAPAYGPVLIPLEPFPTADAEGNISYSQTLTVDPAVLGDPTYRVIVVHGGEGAEGYDPSLPVACGEIEEGVEPPPPGEFDGEYFTVLGPLNDSGVTGSVFLSLEGDQLTVQIEASGVTPDQQHLQHIHGFEDGTVSTCMDTDSYGGVLIPLEPYPTADSEGNISYSQTLTVDPAALMDPAMRAVVIHGMELEGEYNAGLPVACGEIQVGVEPPPGEEQSYNLMFGQLNNSGVSGSGSITLDGDQLTVEIDASGLEANMVHAQHIHGQEEGAAFCPGPDFDADANGTVEIGEGAPAYGGVLQPLFVDVEAETYPTADAEGNVSFSMTYTVDPEAIGDLGDRVVVLHGMTVGEEYVGGQPVACSLVVHDDAMAYAAANLSGDNARPDPIESSGAGSAYFWHDVETGTLYYMLNVTGIEGITAAHIHQGAVDATGGVVLPLFTTGEEESFNGFGILASGQLTSADLSGDLAGMTLEDLIALFGADAATSNAYVNVHSVANPPGEIRDQVVEVLSTMS